VINALFPGGLFSVEKVTVLNCVNITRITASPRGARFSKEISEKEWSCNPTIAVYNPLTAGGNCARRKTCSQVDKSTHYICASKLPHLQGGG